MVDFPVILERMALITIDMQNCFVEGYPLSAPDGLVVYGPTLTGLPRCVARRAC